MKTRTQLLIGFLLVALGSLLVGAFALRATSRLGAATLQLSDHELVQLDALGRIEAGVVKQRFFTSKAITAAALKQPERVEGFWTSREAAREDTEKAMAIYTAHPLEGVEERAWKVLEPGYRAYLQESAAVWKAVRASDGAGADAAMDRIAELVKTQLMAPLAELSAVSREKSRREGEGARQTVSSTQSAVWTAILATLLAATALGVYLALSVTRPIAQVIAEATRLRAAVDEGRISERSDPSAITPEFRPILQGMNETMEAFTRPIRVTADYVDRISRGDVPPPITEQYRGDFDAIKSNLNRCIAAVGALVEDAKGLAAAAVEGQLDRRADPGRHQGDFRKVIEGVNATLNAVIDPVNASAEALERLADRDLCARVTGSYRGDHARMQEAVNATAEALNSALAQVAESVKQVSSAAEQIAATSQAVASGASEQASSLEETSSSLESMTSMTRHAADNAQQANALAGAAKNAAAEGTTAMGEMTAAMVRIKASAEGTSQIIKDINEIAFQTNLLALNAAVEAARAGEAGRGFAVVAEEVRSLALRSKEAANKTEALIRESVKEAVGGEVIAKAVHAKLSEIGVGAAKSYDVMSEISASAKEQAAGIEQITKAIAQMNQVTQQNAASSEESSSAAAELSGQSAELAALVQTFQLDLGVDARASGKPALAMRLVRPGGLARA